MNNKKLINLALSTLVATSSLLPILNLNLQAQAKEVNSSEREVMILNGAELLSSNPSKEEVTPSQKQIVALTPDNFLYANPEKTVASIPSGTALVVTIEKGIMFDAGGTKTQDITLHTSEPILDDDGNVIIPEGSLVQARLVPSGEEGGAYIKAISLHIGGQVVEVSAETELIPGVTLPVKTRLQSAQEFAQLGYIPGLGVGLAIGNEIMGTLFTAGIGSLIGWFSPKDMLAVQIPQNTTYTLEIEEPVALSQELVQAQQKYLVAKSRSNNGQQNAVTPEQVAQYTQELTTAYQQGQISKADYQNLLQQAIEALN